MDKAEIRRRDLTGGALVSTLISGYGSPGVIDGAVMSTLISGCRGGPPGATGARKPLTGLSATAAVEAMRKGDIKAEDYARDLLARAKELEGLNAFRTLSPDRVLMAAQAADKTRSSGAALGVLHGLPLPVKDSVNTKALPTSSGTGALRNFKPRDDAVVMQRLLAQGAILMGKTNLHELSFGWTSNNGVFGPVRNPYNQDRIPGGSSGGSGAAVAARMAPLAVGEDTHGSIRVPSSCCGLAGLRPTFGRYSDDGIMPLTTKKFDQVGPLARSVGDLALFDAAVTGDLRPLAARPLKGVRIGVPPNYFGNDVDPEIERVSREAVRKLREAGATIVEIPIAEVVKSDQSVVSTIILYETLPSITNFLNEQGTRLTFEQMLAQASAGMQADIRGLALAPNRPSRQVYEAMLVKREEIKSATRRYFQEQGIAALAFPSIMIPPPKIGEEVEFVINGQKVPLYVAIARNQSLAPCVSMASLALPAGLTTDGLPVGIQFDALPGGDRELLSLGLSFENALGPIPSPKI